MGSVLFLQEREFEARRAKVICTQLKRDAKISSQVVQHQSLRFLGSLEHPRFPGILLLNATDEAVCGRMVEGSRRTDRGGSVTGLHICQFIESADTC